MVTEKCEGRDECVCVREGDLACMKEEPRVILVDFSTQTDDCGQCRRKHEDS